MVITWCSVPLCKNLASPHKDHQFYPFPTDPNLRAQWVQRTRYTKEIVGREAVCCLHFMKDCFEYNKQTNSYVLKPYAVPNQFLPRKGESESFSITPNKRRITKHDAGLHFSELLRKLRQSAPTVVPRPKPSYLSKEDLAVRQKLKEDPYIREYVLKEAFPNLDYEHLSTLLKKVCDPKGKVTINHSSVKHVISLTYQTTADLEASDELNPRNMVLLARDESYASRMIARELALELDFTGQVSFSDKLPNIYRDNYFDNWPTQRRKRGKIEIVSDSSDEEEESNEPMYRVCNKCCKLVPSEITQAHLESCDFRLAQCATCYVGFLTPKELYGHIKVAHPEVLKETASTTGPFQCGKCQCTFHKLVLFRQHIAEHQGAIQGAKLECALCPLVCSTMAELSAHFSNNHAVPSALDIEASESGQISYKCGYCSIDLANPQQVAEHLQEKHAEKLAGYEQQSAVSETTTKPPAQNKRPLKLTQADMGGPEGTFDIFLCKQCPARYRTLKDFKIHSALTGHQLLPNCIFCECSFSDEKAYNNHINTHDPEKLFRCNKCIEPNINFEDMLELVKHRKTQHPDVTDWLFKHCKICSKGVYAPTMGQHKAFHRLNAQFQCPHCDDFVPYHERKSHAQQHQNEQNDLRKCHFCNVFETKDKLAEHEATYHSEEALFNCALCETNCDSQEALKQHVDTSHRPDEFKSLGPCLYKTIAVENAEYYECRICLIDYVNRVEMLKHIRSDHMRKGRQNTCTICGRIFRRARTLLTHLKKLECQPGQNLSLVKKPCSVCKMWIPKQDHAEHFRRVHPGSFPIECVLCDQPFMEQDDLQQHVDRDHSADERHTFISHNRGYQAFVDGKYQYIECRLCGEVFTHKDTCEKHLRVHSYGIFPSDSDFIMEVDVVEEDAQYLED